MQIARFLEVNSTRYLVLVLLLALLAGFIAGAAQVGRAETSTKYSVYCAGGRIAVDMRTLEQIKSARGGDACRFGEFDYLSDAEDFAKKQFGGVGTACTCK